MNMVMTLILFSNEAWFYFSGYKNSQINMYWSAENTMLIHYVPLPNINIGVWCATSATRLLGWTFFVTIISHWYVYTHTQIHTYIHHFLNTTNNSTYYLQYFWLWRNGGFGLPFFHLGMVASSQMLSQSILLIMIFYNFYQHSMAILILWNETAVSRCGC